jgi:hypothetical protein
MGPGRAGDKGDTQHLAGVHGKVPILYKLAYELRYRQGFAYLDKCGRIINKIQRNFPEWVTHGDPSPQSAALVSMRNGAVLNFSSVSVSLGLEMPVGGDPLTVEDVHSFIESADSITALVIDQLGIVLEQLVRIGFRPWFLFASNDQEDAEAWLLRLGVFSVSDALSGSFGGTIESAQVGIVIAGEDRHFRVGLTGMERQAQLDLGQSVLSVRPRSLEENQREFLQQQMKVRRRMRQNPQFVAGVDIDCYQENPKVLDVRDFLRTSWDQAYERFRSAVGK